jgi:hypothetical protein
MKFAAVHLTFLRSGPALRAPDDALGAWLRLYAYAAELEAGGVIAGARGFGPREWTYGAGTSPEAVSQAVRAGLCEWDGDDLVVSGYDLKGQRAVENRRGNGVFGKTGGRPKKEKVKDNEEKNPHLKPSGKPSSLISSSPLLSPPTPQTDPPGRWSSHDWIRKFGIAWAKAKGRLAYGSPSDSQAAGKFGDFLAGLGDAEAVEAQGVAPAMFTEYLAETGEVAEAGHIFAWFVGRFTGLRERALQRAGGIGGFQPSEYREAE